MSNKTQLQTNNAHLASLINELKEKAASGGASGNIETCTVTLTGTTYGSEYIPYGPRYIYYDTIDADGNIVGGEIFELQDCATITLDNVVCNTILYVQWTNHATDVTVSHGNVIRTIYGPKLYGGIEAEAELIRISAVSGDNVLITNKHDTPSSGGADD